MVLGIPSIGIAKSLLVGKVTVSQGDLGRIVLDGKTVGFAVKADGIPRYWSAGYSIGLGGLKSVIRRYAPVCLRAMSESDREARKQILSA